MEPPAGAAPAEFLYKRNSQAAARRQISRRANASQSPVLPWARRAYETCLSAGSTAVLRTGNLRLPVGPKHQNPSPRETPNPNPKIDALCASFRYLNTWNLNFGISLEFGAWVLELLQW